MSIPPSNEPKWMRWVLIAMHVGTVVCFATVNVLLSLKIASRFRMSHADSWADARAAVCSVDCDVFGCTL